MRPQMDAALFYLPPLPPRRPIASQKDAAVVVELLRADLLSCRANMQQLERLNAAPLPQ